MKKRPAIIIHKLHTYIDEEIDIKVINCKPNEMITLRAKMRDDNEKIFESKATFKANKEGIVSLSHVKPVEGSYNEIDSSGLFWSMEDSQSRHGDFFVKSNSNSVTVDISLEISEETHDTVTIIRQFYNEDIKKVVVKSNECTGVLYHPVKEVSYPGIMLLGGSDGGFLEPAAALLASYGYTVLALAYFGMENVPDNLESIPLEYFEKATQWLKEHPSVNKQVSLIGFSRGGELALLLGATYDEYTSVIAISPSLSGTDDQLWPSGKFIKMMEKYLSDHLYQHKHLFYEGAGHFLAFPYSFPSIPSNIVMQLGNGMAMTFGGSKSANARATTDSWKRIKEFLNTVHA